MLVVDWNTGDESFIDMYLMSNCKFMILANSTFSYWAAVFNNNVQKVFALLDGRMWIILLKLLWLIGK